MHDLFKAMVTFESHGQRLYSFRFSAWGNQSLALRKDVDKKYAPLARKIITDCF